MQCFCMSHLQSSLAICDNLFWRFATAVVTFISDGYINVTSYQGSRDSLLERRTRYRKVAGSNPGRSSRRIFFFRIKFVCWLLFGVPSTPVLLQWHVKDPGHSAKSACGRLHLNTHTPLTQRSRSGLAMPLSRHSVGTIQGNELTCDSVREHSVTVISARWATIDWSWPKSGISLRKLISTSEEKENSAGGE